LGRGGRRYCAESETGHRSFPRATGGAFDPFVQLLSKQALESLAQKSNAKKNEGNSARYVQQCHGLAESFGLPMPDVTAGNWPGNILQERFLKKCGMRKCSWL
jgi:hypothetical protein